MAQVKLIDFWAEWCVDPETPILTEKGYLKASQIQLGQKLVTIDPKTKKISLKKARKIKIFKSKPSRKITLETGRELIGDSHHLILTQEGFKSLAELTRQDKVLVNPVKEPLPYESKDNSTILETTENVFADKTLKQFNLLPLKTSDPKLLILARLLGFVMTDGYLYEDLRLNIYESHFFAGTDEDALEIKKDLASLGFDKLEIKKRSNRRQINGRDFTITTLRCRNFNRALFFLLKALGAPVGRKKNQTYFVPEWILTANAEIKREFMSGWLGGDGCKIDYYIKHDGTSSHDAGFKINAIEFHKEKDLEREGVLYAMQLKGLLEELGVKVRAVSSIDDEDGVIVSLAVATDYESLLALASIEYAYAKTKNFRVPFIREFLQYRLFERQKYSQTKQVVLEQLSLGVGNQTIAQNMSVPVKTVINWRYNHTAQVTHPSNSGQAIFLKWLEERQQEELLWENISQVEEVEPRAVIGITVDNPHTLVTNGIVSHNCGPCKVMDPILEEIESELEGKFEIEKINVDEQPQKAEEFGVMSIPTYVIMKDGKEVTRKIGVTPKAELVKLLTS